MTGDQRDPAPNQSAVAKCCNNSAAMLHLADSEGEYTPQQRRDFQKHNRGQARLLIEAGKIADEMLAALKAAKAVLEWDDDHPSIYVEPYKLICAAIAKAEGSNA